MRILFLLTQDLESPLGIGRIWPLAKELAKRGHRVRIAALHSRWDELNERRFERERVIVQYVGPMHVRKVGSQKQYYSMWGLLGVALRATWALTRAAMLEPVDIIHVGKPHPMNSIAGLTATRLRGGLLCVDCDDYEAASNRFGAGWQRRVVAFFERHIPRKAQVVTTHTQFLWEKLVAWGCSPEQIHFLPNGVDIERFSPPDMEMVATIQKKLCLEGRQVVGYLGTLSLANHPVDLLIQAFALLVRELPRAVMLLVGGGDDFNGLQLMAKRLGVEDKVIFTGRVAPSEVPLYYALTDVSVDPVYDDDTARGRLPIKMFESWRMGVPFVTAAVGERAKLAGNPPACMLAEPAGDASALAKAIHNVLTSRQLSESLRQRGLERVKNYHWDILAGELEAVYRKALWEINERNI